MFVCLQDDAVMENNMKMEVTGKLKTHFNTAPKHNNTTAGVSVIMVSTQKHSQTNLRTIHNLVNITVVPNFSEIYCSPFLESNLMTLIRLLALSDLFNLQY